MAAFDTPWTTLVESMSSPAQASSNGARKTFPGPNGPTIASFSPVQTRASLRARGTLQVEQQSPLLISTPPQITRALVYSHPFLLPLNKLLGLITWSSGDEWESFLLLASFWAVTLYGDEIILFSGPVLVVSSIMLGMYWRRFSPLSTKVVTDDQVEGGNRQISRSGIKYQKSLDEIVDTLNLFTSRCNILLEPLLQFTDFLSTQQTAISASTRPMLRTLFFRILTILPFWIVLARPARIITSRRVVMVWGTVILTWHSRPAQVTRTLLWRSLTVRRATSYITGLEVATTSATPISPPPLPPRRKSQQEIATSIAVSQETRRVGVRFTYSVYENQRRWIGLGWTNSLFAYERGPWTDEHLNATRPKSTFELPSIEGAGAKWQWVSGSEWKVEGNTASNPTSEGWIYYDNKWNDGRRQDGWGRYTRRRKWYRDAELVEIEPSSAAAPTELPAAEVSTTNKTSGTDVDSDGNSHKLAKQRGLFRKQSTKSSLSNKSMRDTERDDEPVHPAASAREADWHVGDDMRMGLDLG